MVRLSENIEAVHIRIQGNYNSRGSIACITIHPDDADAFFSHFTWINDKKTTGNSQGRIFISRDKETKGKKR
jgi:hypothetical protein